MQWGVADLSERDAAGNELVAQVKDLQSIGRRSLQLAWHAQHGHHVVLKPAHLVLVPCTTDALLTVNKSIEVQRRICSQLARTAQPSYSISGLCALHHRCAPHCEEVSRSAAQILLKLASSAQPPHNAELSASGPCALHRRYAPQREEVTRTAVQIVFTACTYSSATI